MIETETESELARTWKPSPPTMSKLAWVWLPAVMTRYPPTRPWVEGVPPRNIRLDLAYLKWTGLEDTALSAGKFKNPYYVEQKNGLIWDGDFRPEGLAAQWAGDMFFANASYNFIESDSNNDSDGLLGITARR